MVEGFGVKLNGELLIRTVSNTELAAKVNGLCLCFGLTPGNNWPDAVIDNYWNEGLKTAHDKNMTLAIVPVKVTEIEA